MNLNKAFIDDCRMWRTFLKMPSMTTLCCPFTDFNESLEPTVLPFYTDVSLNVNLGLGGWFDNKYIVARWGVNFINKYRPSIEFLELFALVAGVLTWLDDPRMNNAWIAIHCDNESVMNMVNHLTSSCMQCVKLLRIMVLDNIIKNRKIKVLHVKSRDNNLADAFSRMDFGRFWRDAPVCMAGSPSPLPAIIWWPEKVWLSA